MKLSDPKVEVYTTGAELFLNSLTSPDLLSYTPLEAAYYWTLFCRSFLDGTIDFGDNIKFSIKCKSLKSGCMFPDSNSSNYVFDFLEYNTMYYVNERNGLDTHRLADFFSLVMMTNLFSLILLGEVRNQFRVRKIILSIGLRIIKEKLRNIKNYEV